MMFAARLKQFAVTGAATLILSTALVTATHVYAAPTVRLSGNVTEVALSQDLVGALTGLGVKPSAVGYSALIGTHAYFPISSGAIDAANAKGEIVHLGGLRLTAGDTRVELSDFIIDTVGTPRLTGLVTANGDVVARIPLFNLDLPKLTLPLMPTGRRLVVPGVAVTLTQEAATALNGVFNINAFQPGFSIGTAKVSARIRSSSSAPH
jgi:hypothetical protein